MKPRLVIVGGGGHAKVIIDILEQVGEFEIAGFVSVPRQADSLCGYPCLGADQDLAQALTSGIDFAFVAIGDNQRRRESIGRVLRQGFSLANAISPRAVISRSATLGRGIAIMPGAVVNTCARLADGVIVNTNAGVDHDCVLGSCVHVGPGAAVAGGVRLGDEVFLGAGVSVIPGVAIGAHTTVGAGAAVVNDLPANVVAAGVPAVVKHAKRDGVVA